MDVVAAVEKAVSDADMAVAALVTTWRGVLIARRRSLR